MIRSLILLLLFLALASESSFAQKYSTNWNYDISDGLPTNSIYHLLIDSKGKVWFGSDLGVTCYDGQKFKTYTTDDGLEDNTVLRCFEDRSGKIWFHHNNRMPSYFENGEIHKLISNNKNILVSSSSEFAQTSDGTIYLGCITGFLLIDEKMKTRFIQESSPNNYSIVGARNDQIYIFGSSKPTKKVPTINFDHTFNYDGDHILNVSIILNRSVEYTFDNYFSNNNEIVLDPILNTLTKDEVFFLKNYDNKTYFSTGNGVFILGKKNGHLFVEDHIMEGKKINSLDFDVNGNLWATSLGNGIFFFPKNGISTIHQDPKKKVSAQFTYNNSILYGFKSGEILSSIGRAHV